MNYFPMTEEENLARLAELMDAQDQTNQGVIDNTKLPEVKPDLFETEVARQYAEKPDLLGLQEESTLMGLPQQAKFARGIHSPQSSLVAPSNPLRGFGGSKQDTQKAAELATQGVGNGVPMQTPSEEFLGKQANAKHMIAEPVAAPGKSELDWDAMVRDAMKDDSQSRFAQGIERAGRELLGGLTLTRPDTQSLVTQVTNEEGKVRGLQAAQRKYALDKQEADDNRAMKQARIDTDRMGKEAYAKQIEAQMQQMKLNADLKAKELEQQGKEAEAKDLRAKADAQLDAWYKKQMAGIGWKNAETGRISAENRGEAADAVVKSKAALAADKNTEGIPYGYKLAPGANPSLIQRNEGTNLLAQSKDIQEESKKLNQLLDRKGLAIFDPTSEAHTLAKQSAERLKGAARVAEGLGVPTGPDMAILDSLIGNPLSLKSIGLGQFKNVINSNSDHYTSKADRRLQEVYGIVRANKTQDTPASGMVKVVRLSDGKSVMKTPENAKAMLEAAPDEYKIEE